MQQWVADGQTRGLNVNYTPTGSPTGLQQFQDNQIDFAGTEAEYHSYFTGTTGAKSYQYTPDVAGAIAVMYHLQDQAGHDVDYLHLSQRTIALIFTGYITSWADPRISQENAGVKFPDKPITTVYRSGQSGTTALFYDFVQHNLSPSEFRDWAVKNNLTFAADSDRRIIDVSSTPQGGPTQHSYGASSSDQIAQYIAGSGGTWTIGYDEFGYAKVYGAKVAWVQNDSGQWVQPYAQNISAALEAAKLRQDLSQELSGVYRSRNPLAYPISAYSYLMTKCEPAPDRPTCTGGYGDNSIAQTLDTWMRYIACDGQVNMAKIGYSPLPPNLSQELINSIGRMEGRPAPLQLNPGNCANPTFHGGLGAGATSPPDPFAKLPGGVAAATSGRSASTPGAAAAPGSSATSAVAGSASDPASSSAAGNGVRALGGSGKSRAAEPAAYRGKGPRGTSLWPLATLAATVAGPPIVMAARRRKRARARG